jgi:hypothetical protein
MESATKPSEAVVALGRLRDKGEKQAEDLPPNDVRNAIGKVNLNAVSLPRSCLELPLTLIPDSFQFMTQMRPNPSHQCDVSARIALQKSSMIQFSPPSSSPSKRKDPSSQAHWATPSRPSLPQPTRHHPAEFPAKFAASGHPYPSERIAVS